MQKVASSDGTEIAYDVFGTGPGLILVAGAFTARSFFTPYVEALSTAFTVVNYDRRGRGDSGDTSPYAVEREWEDLAAVQAATGARFACAFSSGSMALLQSGVPFERLAVVEPPFRTEDAPPVPDRYVARLQELDAAGAAELWLQESARQTAAALPRGTAEGHEGTFHTVSPQTLTQVLAGFFRQA